MTDEPSSATALDTVIRQVRYLVFAFDGPVRRVMTKTSEDPAAAAPPAPYIQEALAACRESGRSAAIISASPPAEVWAYLEAHDLSTQIAVVAAQIGEAAAALEALPTECAVITTSPSDIQAAEAAGVTSIGYAKTRDNADHLAATGATATIFSMADLTLGLRRRATD